ncbi:palmitoyltransferase ZDHHC4-like [Diadema antillarum]|uniref:palmitoyltransferase ZDHHC4-like n=1 Tax=Diadema antillarum TaxID=105358 RepID=UPI003A878233
MDFLTLMITYGVTFGVASYILLLGDTDFHRNGVIGSIRRGSIQIVTRLSLLLPQSVQDGINNGLEYLLYKRNPVFKYVYVVILLLVAYYYTTEVLPVATTVGAPPLVILGTYTWFVWCLWLYLFCCGTDPGVISKTTLHHYGDVYEFDEELYLTGRKCWTCGITKPARSKHCVTCDHCVHRFDHHCTWLNNCIGGLNVRYFLLLLMSLTLGTSFVSYSIASTLRLFAETSGLLRASYVGPDGILRPVTWQVAVQHLFMERPMPIFIMVSLALLSILIAAFTLYHLYLALSNQTTNERYKRSRISTHVHSQEACSVHSHGQKTTEIKNSRKRPGKRRQCSGHVRRLGNIYNTGLVSNIVEVVCPHAPR